MMAYSFNPSTQEVEAGQVPDFQATLAFRVNKGYTEKPCLNKAVAQGYQVAQ